MIPILLGNIPDWEIIYKIAKKYNIHLITGIVEVPFYIKSLQIRIQFEYRLLLIQHKILLS